MMRPLLNHLSKNSTVGNWNSQIREAINNGYSHKALLLYRQMKENGFSADNLTFPFVAKACAKSSDFKISQIIHTHIIKSPFCSNLFVGTAVIDMYVKCNQLKVAHKVFDEMPVRDVTLWNAMLLGFAHSCNVDGFFVLFRDMRIQEFAPDFVTIIGLTQSVVELSDLNLLRGVHAFGICVGMMNDVSLANTLISGYSKCGDLVSAEGVFERIAYDSRTVVSWGSLIAGYALNDDYYRTFRLYQRMLKDDGHKPGISTFLSLLSSCVQPEALTYGTLIHSHVIQFGCDYDVAVTNTLMTMYSKCGDIDSAWCLFQNMTCRTCVSWTAIISGYAANGCIDVAYSLFLDMQAAGERPDAVTLVSLLSGCGQTGSLELGRSLDKYAFCNGLRDNVKVCNAIIDMYAKSGDVDKAKELFHSMPSKTIVSWTTMISGLALNGDFTEAIDLFAKIVKLGLKPNHITFLAVLQACTHAGFLDKGMEVFNLMTNVYKFNPGLEHCSCMVDLLGRKGKFKEALEFIESMSFDPDAAIWGALLNACKIHNNVEIGEYAAYHLYQLDPQASVSYVEMANMYASAGRWDRVSKVRTLMKCNKVKKYPGLSVIQVDGKNHMFGVEERYHPEGLQIYEVLDVLAFELKDNGTSYHFEDLSEHESDLQEFLIQQKRIYVAVGEDAEESESALNWALKLSEGDTICVIHVVVPAQKFPQPSASQTSSNAVGKVDVKEFQEWPRKEVVEMVDEWLKMCDLNQVPYENFYVEKEVITEGILELISQLEIRKLVMGAGVNNKKLRIKRPTSRKSNYVLRFAPVSCYIWFVSKDRLIYARNGMKQMNPNLEESSLYTPSAESVQTLGEVERSRQETHEESETQKAFNKVKSTKKELKHVIKGLKKIQIKLHTDSKKLLQEAGASSSLLERQVIDSILKGNETTEEKLNTKMLQKYKKRCEEVKLECDNAIEAAQVLQKQVSQEPSSFPKFSCEFSQLDIQEATRCFHPSLKIVERESYSVYKGFLYYTEVAIKTHKHDWCILNYDKEVDVLSKLRHPNLVTLIGACPDSLSLIYEYLPNGNLEDRLSCKDNTPPLPWATRTRIVTELCAVLNFLHSMKPCSIIHGQLNLRKILLDVNFRCKLGGFGLCHVISDDSSFLTGLLLEAGHLSTKSDVYSFGIILLQLLTGRPTLKVVEEIQDALENDRLHSMLDTSAGDWPIIRAKQLAYMALKCCDVNPKDRPDLASEVWSVLKPVITPSESLSSPLQLLTVDQVPSHFLCPIFQEIMREPHLAADGFTYEGDGIRGWFEGGNDTSPMTNLKLDNLNLIPNRSLRSAIQEFLLQHQRA